MRRYNECRSRQHCRIPRRVIGPLGSVSKPEKTVDTVVSMPDIPPQKASRQTAPSRAKQ